MSKDLKGKVALVTGAAKRIGRETALALASEGADVVVHYSNSEHEAQELAHEIESLGAKSWLVQADFSKRDEYGSLMSRALEASGRIDILVNNASSFPQATLESLDFADFISSMEINAWTPFQLSRDFARLAGKGTIINLLDSRLRGYEWNHVGYILAKQVLELLTRMTALEYAPDITVNAIGPGLILPPPGKDVSYIEAMADTLPLKKHGDPKDIADAVVYLAKTGFVTGQVIYVDGGRHLHEYVCEK
ncbi:MAG: SDR family oxidoreductase [Armatimonadota bacterium]